MKIAICGSLDFAQEIGQIAEQLKKQGHQVVLPATAIKILTGELSVNQIKAEKESGNFSQRAINSKAIKTHWQEVKNSDAILALNYSKKGINNYVGGNVFLEMGFAHVLAKKIFLLNPIPKMNYRDEIEAMQPIILNNDLSKIK